MPQNSLYSLSLFGWSFFISTAHLKITYKIYAFRSGSLPSGEMFPKTSLDNVCSFLTSKIDSLASSMFNAPLIMGIIVDKIIIRWLTHAASQDEDIYRSKLDEFQWSVPPTHFECHIFDILGDLILTKPGILLKELAIDRLIFAAFFEFLYLQSIFFLLNF